VQTLGLLGGKPHNETGLAKSVASLIRSKKASSAASTPACFAKFPPNDQKLVFRGYACTTTGRLSIAEIRPNHICSAGADLD
jgi:hypothetical protein